MTFGFCKERQQHQPMHHAAICNAHHCCTVCAFVWSRLYWNCLRTQMVQHSWTATCEEMGETLPLTPAVAKLRPQLCRELKTKSSLIKAMYGFKTGQNKKTIPYNQKLTEDLKEGSAFAFKVAMDLGTEFGSFEDKPASILLISEHPTD
ncbi:hypothetical protein B0H10DRAFT_1953782 [Mycena sp. CBHHK59/15]|nr:hypothetical protein B0H10DRAFT_1953782 [Mycena sp. CBHHK59/15]